MPIANTGRVLNYLPYAMGSYGTGPGTAGTTVGTSAPVAVKDFTATPGSGFQGSLYKDAATGKYTVAIAGTNDAIDALHPDRVLATANMLSTVSAGIWDPQMTDAIKFVGAAFQQIQKDYADQGREPPTLDDLRKMVDVTGHSLGGSLGELAAKFYGLSGANIDGPGVAALLVQPQFASLKQEMQLLHPELRSDYILEPGKFGAYAYTVVGVAGTHLEDIEFQRAPRADAAEASMLTAAGGMAIANWPAILLSAGVAGATGLAHPSSLILKETEEFAGIAPVAATATSPFPTLHIGDAVNLPLPNPGSSTVAALRLKGDAYLAQQNVADGLSPSGLPLDGTPQSRGQFTAIAFRDPEAGRIVEVFTHVNEAGDASTGAAPIRKEYAVDFHAHVRQAEQAHGATYAVNDFHWRVAA